MPVTDLTGRSLHYLYSIRSMAAGKYPVGLDDGMGPEGTGSGPLGLGRC